MIRGAMTEAAAADLVSPAHAVTVMLYAYKQTSSKTYSTTAHHEWRSTVRHRHEQPGGSYPPDNQRTTPNTGASCRITEHSSLIIVDHVLVLAVVIAEQDEFHGLHLEGKVALSRLEGDSNLVAGLELAHEHLVFFVKCTSINSVIDLGFRAEVRHTPSHFHLVADDGDLAGTFLVALPLYLSGYLVQA